MPPDYDYDGASTVVPQEHEDDESSSCVPGVGGRTAKPRLASLLCTETTSASGCTVLDSPFKIPYRGKYS